VEKNPRQVKGFINRFILALSVNESVEAEKFLVGEVLSSRWYDIYRYITDASFVNVLNSYLGKRAEGKGEQFLSELENKMKDKDNPPNVFERILISYKDDSALWDFVDTHRETIFGKKEEGVIEESTVAKDWEKYQSVSGSTNIHIPTIKEVQTRNSRVFVSMPYREDLNEIYQKGTIPALQENGFDAIRPDREVFIGDKMEFIKKTLESARFIIAVLTDKNPNVIFEVGYALALKLPVIVLATSMEDVPFDVRNLRIILYKSVTDLRTTLSQELAVLRKNRRI
jgi:hypothetical protein